MHISKSHFSVTANMFTFRKIFEEVGLFDEQRYSGGDKDWGNRVYNSGYQLLYEEKAVVMHPARVGLRSFYVTIARKTAARFDRDRSFFKHLRLVPPVRRPIKQIILNKMVPGVILKLKLVMLMYFETYAPNLELLMLVFLQKKPERN
jgi:GT2 family glycosyltransferase